MLKLGVSHSIWYRLRRRDMVCFQFRAAKWASIIGLRRQPSSNPWLRKPKVVATGVVVSLMEWVAMLAICRTIDVDSDSLGTIVDNFEHRSPAFRGTTLHLYAECVGIGGQRSLWTVSAKDGERLIATGTVGFSVQRTEEFLDRWAPSTWRRWRAKPRWCYVVWAHNIAPTLREMANFFRKVRSGN